MHPTAVLLTKFLARLPSIRDTREVLSQSVEAAMAGAGARAGIGRYWGRPSDEAGHGPWPDDANAWLEEVTRRWREGASPAGVQRLRSGLHHCVAVPLVAEGRALGILSVSRSRALTGSQEETLLTIARGTGATLDSLSQQAHTQRRLEQLALLFDIGVAMNSILDVRQLLDEIMHRGQETMGAEACSVLLVDEERRELFFEIAQGEAGAALEQVRLKMDQGIAGWIATNGKPLIINDVSNDPRFFRQVDQEVRFVTRAILGAPLLARGKTIGVIEVVNKRDGREFTNEDLDLLTALAADAAISIDNARLFQAVLGGYLDTIKALAAAVDAKDPYTAGHIDRVSSYSIEVGQELGFSDDEMTALRYGSILHDVGKIGIADAILGKPAPLTQEEFVIMSSHADIGSRMLEGIRFLSKAQPIARHHHETLDGRGYPDGLAGEAIPLGARIVCAVDAFDAMTTDRPYRKALTVEFAIGELRKKAGIQFDPQVVEAFARVLQRRGMTILPLSGPVFGDPADEGQPASEGAQ